MKKGLFRILLSSWILFTPSSIPAQSTPQEKFKPDDEKRSAIVDAHGYAYLAEDKTIKSPRQEAYADAKRQAAESAQTHIQSLTKVEKFAPTPPLPLRERGG